jgi:hypothetical protein
MQGGVEMTVRKFTMAGILALGLAATWSLVGTSTAIVRADEPIVITGEVTRFEPGKVIVIRSSGRETTYTLTPTITVPADVAVGKSVSLQIEAGTGGTQVVRSVTTTTTTTSSGGTTQTTEVTRETTATGTMITGTVETYLPGKSITVIDGKGARVTYVLAPESSLPADVIMGKTVTVYVAKGQPTATYLLERDGETIKIRAKIKKE